MEDTFQRIYEKYHHDLFQFLFYLVKSREQAEDLVQEVYIRVLKSYDRFEGRSSEKTWLFSIARHVAIDWFRKQNSLRQRIIEKFDWDRQQLVDSHALPDEVVLQNEQIKWMYKSLNNCTFDQRSVLVLRYIQELSISETAEALGWTVSKVKTTQHRALKHLQKVMSSISEKEGHPIGKTGVE
ncbi:RNA polymerase sigma factor SigX [Metabacillus malikii]|uniref:RNA polymerase sigma factor n=1 Tax=Metabacillus malikii TaxID=1504265 RepID=A0ABT9ZKU7_9BACI|nr:RNA polymerase sigma factor SigX [Metabacillus malikii]MDQ0232921.1 RNA polymerase sigma-70 factor (ECF subfamily) [Metabacillus malikii]